MIWLPVWLREHYMLCGDQSLSVIFTGQPFLLVLLLSWNSGNGVTL